MCKINLSPRLSIPLLEVVMMNKASTIIVQVSSTISSIAIHNDQPTPVILLEGVGEAELGMSADQVTSAQTRQIYYLLISIHHGNDFRVPMSDRVLGAKLSATTSSTVSCS